MVKDAVSAVVKVVAILFEGNAASVAVVNDNLPSGALITDDNFALIDDSGNVLITDESA